jgi:hypothetical protein
LGRRQRWRASRRGARPFRHARLRRSLYRLVRRGAIRDDDEVCVLHAVRELDFAPLTYAMINVRFTLRRMRRRGTIDGDIEAALADALKRIHFRDRTREALIAAATTELGPAASPFVERFIQQHQDVKARDAELMCRRMLAEPATAKAKADWDFPRTSYWIEQFERDIADVPALGQTLGC